MALQKVKDTMRTTVALDATKLAGAVPTGSLGNAVAADDSITLAKMAPGTDGQVITYSAAGDPVAIGPGTAGQVLTSAGANLPQTFADAGAGGLKLIRETSITAVSYIDMTGFDDSKYSGYKLMIENMRPGTDETYLHLRTSSDGGTSFNSNAGYPNGYRYNGKEFSQGNAEADVHNNTSATFIRMCVLLLRSDGNGVFNGTWDILGTPSTGSTSISGLTTYSPSVGGVHTQIIGGLVIPLTLTNAIRLSISSGTFYVQGVVRLFGYTTTV